MTSSEDPLWDGREPEPTRSLPAVSTRHIGMHLGGEPNTSEAKRPWLDDLEEGNLRYLLCYRLVDHPLRGGTFGVDLYVGNKGGQAEIRGIRQKLGAEDFEGCMSEALSQLDFHHPARPTMLSYSLRFDVDD